MKNFFPAIKLLLGWPISLLALIFIFNLIIAKGEVVFPNIREINFPVFFLGIIILLLYFFLRSFFWQQILKGMGYKLPFNEVVWLWASSEFKRYAPGKIWLFLGRALLFTQRGVKNKDVFSALFIEAGFLVLSSVLLSIFSLPLIIKTMPFFHFLLNPIIFLLILALIVIGTFLFVYNVRFAQKINFKPLLYILPRFSAGTNLYLLVLAIIVKFLFGFGTYLTILAIFPLVGNAIEWVGFFIFAFLVGYLSFITPMGLGVREGVMVIGLSKFIGLTTAGMISIYSRIVLTLAELLFLAVAYILAKAKTFSLQKITIVLVFILVGLYAVYFTTASFLRFDNFYAGRYDLGNMDQVVWNTINGRIFETNDDFGNIASRLSSHADFLLIFLAPSYLLWADPRMLLLLQTVILALGAIFIFLIAQRVLKNKTIGILFAFVYLVNPHVQHANLYDFHAVTLATTFLLAAFYFLITKSYGWFLLFAILSALTKEQIWLVIGLFGVYIFFFHKKRLFGSAVFLVSLSLFYFLIWQVIPSARGAQHFALSYYSDFGDSPTAIIKNTLFSPDKILGTVLIQDRKDYLYQLFLPLGFLSILSPVSLLPALPDLLVNLLSSNANLRQIYFHYTAVITPFLFIGAIFGIKNLQKIFPKIPLFFYSAYLIFATLYGAYSFGPLPGAKKPNIDMFVKPQPNKEVISRVLSQIDRKYIVAATNNLGAHLSQRRQLFTIPVGVDKADVVLFLLNDQSALPSLAFQKDLAEKMKTDKNYALVFEQGDFVVFKKQGVELSFFD